MASKRKNKRKTFEGQKRVQQALGTYKKPERRESLGEKIAGHLSERFAELKINAASAFHASAINAAIDALSQEPSGAYIAGALRTNRVTTAGGKRRELSAKNRAKVENLRH